MVKPTLPLLLTCGPWGHNLVRLQAIRKYYGSAYTSHKSLFVFPTTPILQSFNSHYAYSLLITALSLYAAQEEVPFGPQSYDLVRLQAIRKYCGHA